MLAPQTLAPEFTLPDSNGTMISLHEYRGETVVLVFYPKDDSPVCTRQLKDYATHYEEFSGKGARIFAISTDDVGSHERFRTSCAFPFPLLSDGDKSVCRAYGVLNLLGKARRAVFVIDGEGVIRWSDVTSAIRYIAPPRVLEVLAQ